MRQLGKEGGECSKMLWGESINLPCFCKQTNQVMNNYGTYSIKSMSSNLHAAYSLHPLSQSNTHTNARSDGHSNHR